MSFKETGPKKAQWRQKNKTQGEGTKSIQGEDDPQHQRQEKKREKCISEFK